MEDSIVEINFSHATRKMPVLSDGCDEYGVVFLVLVEGYDAD